MGLGICRHSKLSHMNADFFFPWLFCQPSSPLGGGAAGLQKKEHVQSLNLAYNHIKVHFITRLKPFQFEILTPPTELSPYTSTSQQGLAPRGGAHAGSERKCKCDWWATVLQTHVNYKRQRISVEYQRWEGGGVGKLFGKLGKTSVVSPTLHLLPFICNLIAPHTWKHTPVRLFMGLWLALIQLILSDKCQTVDERDGW